jgi:gamma-glutamyl hercynylcysteine S-oxide synthase
MTSHDVIRDELTRARARTLALVDCLSEDDQRAQVSPLMSPMVWDLAHIGNYEELWLLRELDGRAAIDPALDDLYNAFEHPRWSRPSLPILGPAEARAYNAKVRDEVVALLDTLALDRAPSADGDRLGRLLDRGFVYGMVIQHEHQHDETLLATHQLRGERAVPPPDTTPAPRSPASAVPTGDVRIEGGRFVFGTDDDPWAYDNERGAHEVELAPFLLDRTPVTNRQFVEFVLAGGYDDERLWHPDGWRWRQEHPAEAPEFWRQEGERSFSVLRFGERLDLDELLDEPVQHVSWYEADAFARWAGKRLPTEVEWERAATWDPATGTKRRYPWGDDEPTARQANLGQRHRGPAAVGAYPNGASPEGVLGLIGDVWEWTSSDFLAHPGFVAFPYREYSEVFWGSEYKVLRGGSWAADRTAVRGTFRNWDYPIRRQIFSGFRCARDA